MQFRHIKGLLIQEFFVTIRSYEVILDIFVLPSMLVVVFGFLANYLSGTTNPLIAHSLLTGMLFWQIIFVVQYSVSVSSLWNIWSRNLSNMFIAPMTLPEYIIAQIISATFKAISIFVPTSLLAIPIFHFNIYTLGFANLFFFSLCLAIFAVSFGLIVLGLIFRFGTRIQAFAWGLLPILQPIAAVFYPVQVLPAFLQPICYALPPTYIFEAIRATIAHPGIQWQSIGISFALDIVYFLFSLWFFNYMFNKSKEKGQFARLES
jgi:ABC-2 type transport system permease protein